MATLEKKHIYKISRNGRELGNLEDVKSQFNYNQNINSAAVALEIVVGKTADTSSFPVEELLDEAGNPLLTEDGQVLTTEREPDVVGDDNENALIRNDNDVEVWEYSEYYPNGILVYSGFISKWKPLWNLEDEIVITCLTKSQDLEHYLTPGSAPDTLDQSQTTSDTNGFGFWSTRRYGQIFQTGASTINISKIILRHWKNSQTRTYTVKIWNSIGDATIGGTPLGSASTAVGTGAFELTEITYTFGTSVTLTPNTSYFFSLEVDSGSIAGDSNTWGNFDSNSGSPYANGSIYKSFSGAAWENSTTSGDDFWFKTYYRAPSTAITYINDDPSTDILADIMDEYSSSGGIVTLDPVVATGVNVPEVTFNLNTILEGIQKVSELGPADWYYYVDPATLVLYYQEASATADHTLIKGRHIETLEIEATKERIANVGYFTGGDDGTGQNVYVTITDTDSLVTNRRGIIRLSDPKVQDEDTARLILQNYMDRNNAQVYIAQCEVIDGTHDITLFKPGHMIGFAGFGTFVDRLLLQVVGIGRQKSKAVLLLGVLPKRDSAKLEELKRSLEATQTVDNPDTPS